MRSYRNSGNRAGSNASRLHSWDYGDIQMVAGIYAKDYFPVSYELNFPARHHLNPVDRPFNGGLIHENP